MLKKKNLFLIAMTLVCALTFTACGKKIIETKKLELSLKPAKKKNRRVLC